MPRFLCFGNSHSKYDSTTDSYFNSHSSMELPKSLVSERPLRIQKHSEKPTYSSHDLTADAQHDLRYTLSLMIQQETAVYTCDDYLYISLNTRKVLPDTSNPIPTYKGNRLVDEFCREQIGEWLFRVIDFFQVSREAVYLAISFLDRFMEHYNLDRASYKLAATTCLIIAIKVHHSKRIFIAEMIPDLSRGEFYHDDIVRMEKQILSSLSWMLNPPTPQNFIHRLLLATTPITKKIIGFDVYSIHDYATFFSELSVLDYHFVTQRQSVVALACILNAIEGLGLLTAKHASDPFFVHRDPMSNFIINMCMLVHQEPNLQYMSYMREKLWNLFERSDECTLVTSRSFFKSRSILSQRSFSLSIQSESSVHNSSTSSSPTSITRPIRL